VKGIDITLTFTSITEAIRLMYVLFTNEPSSKWRLSVKPWTKKRTVSANNQQHLWYGQIAKNEGDKSPEYVKRYCKYTFGLPLVLNSEKHGEFYETLLDRLSFYELNYEQQVDLMECIEVSSKLTTTESKMYMDQMIFYFNDLGIPIKYKGE